MASNRGSIPEGTPEGYLEFLFHAQKRERWAEEHIAKVLAEGLHVSSPDLIEQTALRRAAEHVRIALEHNGWELMFDADGNFATVVV